MESCPNPIIFPGGGEHDARMQAAKRALTPYRSCTEPYGSFEAFSDSKKVPKKSPKSPHDAKMSLLSDFPPWH